MIGLPTIANAWQPVTGNTMWFLEFKAWVPCRCSCGDEHGGKVQYVVVVWSIDGYITAPLNI